MWNWEPNEMLALLEHMFIDLNLNTEFKISNLTLKKWLVSLQNQHRVAGEIHNSSKVKLIVNRSEGGAGELQE